MLYTYAVKPQTVIYGDPVVFQENGVEGCSSIKHIEGLAVTYLRKPGYYIVEANFDATMADADAGTLLTFALFDGEKPIPGATISHTILTPGNVRDFTIMCGVKVCQSCACCDNVVHLKLVNTTPESTAEVTKAALVVHSV